MKIRNRRSHVWSAFAASLIIVTGGCPATVNVDGSTEDMDVAEGTDDDAIETENGDVDAVDNDDNETDSEDVERPSGWADETHSNDTDPNYEQVFARDVVHSLTIEIPASEWGRMQSNLDTLFGSTGGGGGPGGGGMNNFPDENPTWGEATVRYDDNVWTQVGVRYKGNSSLSNAYRSGGLKFPFKLDFDEWEGEYPSINNQRFYGFKQLNLNNNFDDSSFLRESAGADLFREFGVPAARTAYYEVFLDIGDGPERVGMYTLVEEIDDSMIESQFEDDEGNLYKPDGDAASFAFGTFDVDEMGLKDGDEENMSDIQQLYDAIHDSSRTSDPDTYMSQLETIFDVDQYLRYLAVNQTIQNWDTYGRMTHNYFLYNDGGQFVWIPWDNNEAFQTGKGGGALSLDLASVNDQWPLLRYIIDVPEYEATYQQYLGDFTAELFNASDMSARYDEAADVITPTLTNAERSSFESALSTLKSHASSRENAVSAYVD